MKKLLLLSLIILPFCNALKAQEAIKELSKQKEILSNEIKVLEDSIKSIEIRINYLKTSGNLEIGDVAIEKVGTLMETQIRDKPEWSGKVIAILPKYKMLEVYSFSNGFWLIKRDSIKGYADYESIGELGEMTKIRKEYELIALSKQYGEVNAKKILNYQIWIGMTPREATQSIGRPNEVNSSTGSYGTHEQWVYDKKNLYFENGKLTSWQD